MNALLNAVSNLGGDIAGGMGDMVGGLGDMIGDPSEALGLDYLSKLFDDPEEFQKYLLEMEGQSRGGGGGVGVGIPRINSLPPMSLPTGGFVGQNPQFMNTDQLILRGE